MKWPARRTPRQKPKRKGWWIVGSKPGLITLLLLATISFFGCGGAITVVETVGSAASAAGAWWSYKALRKDPVEVTTIGRECGFYQYVRVPCGERGALSAETKKAIADNNRLAVEFCPGMERPAALDCPTQ